MADAPSLGPVVDHLVPVEGRSDWGSRLVVLLNVDVCNATIRCCPPTQGTHPHPLGRQASDRRARYV